jgi:hypothetical protein
MIGALSCGPGTNARVGSGAKAPNSPNTSQTPTTSPSSNGPNYLQHIDTVNFCNDPNMTRTIQQIFRSANVVCQHNLIPPDTSRITSDIWDSTGVNETIGIFKDPGGDYLQLLKIASEKQFTVSNLDCFTEAQGANGIICSVGGEYEVAVNGSILSNGAYDPISISPDVTLMNAALSSLLKAQ